MDAKEKLNEWERESARMYTGYVASVVFEGREYLIDSKKVEAARLLGAKQVPFRLV